MKQGERLENLSKVLAESGRVRLAILFGSQATGRARPDSDVDIGIVPTAELSLAEELSLAQALEEVVRSPVDLVRLDRGDALLGREVATTGLCLFEEKAGAFTAYRAMAMAEWIDFDEVMAPHRAALLHRLASS